MTKRDVPKKCEHQWLYEHMVYWARRDPVAVHRQCNICGEHQMVKRQPWGPVPPRGYDVTEMRSEMEGERDDQA